MKRSCSSMPPVHTNKEEMMRGRPTLFFIAILMLATVAGAQTSITQPPDGENQHATVSQYLGLVKVTIDYHSPKVHNPRGGEDRRGKIYGTLVPYGPQKTLGFGTCTECPWRAGANENTTFTTSNDVLIEGQPLPAGAYGLSMIPGQDEWTIIFSKNSTSWGSFFYDPADDAKNREKALTMGEPGEMHQYGRQLLQQGKKQEALSVFQLNAKKHPNEWPVNVGLARGNSAVGNYKEALKYAKLALAQAPDD